MQISPITSYKNQTSFQAINLKYLQKAQKYHRRNWGIDVIIDDIRYSVYYGSMSKQDGIETMEAIKPYIGKGETLTWNSSMRFIKNLEV